MLKKPLYCDLDTYHGRDQATQDEPQRPFLGSSSSHSISIHFISGHSVSISGHSLSRHTPPNTTDADTSTPPRFVHPSLARTPRCSEAYLRWRSSPLSTMYPPMIFESSAGDSSSESSAGPSPLVPSHADLLPPHKRFRDSISPKDSVEEDIDTDVFEIIKADAMAIEVAVDRDVKAGVDAVIDMEVDIRVDVEDEVEDEVESIDRGTIEVGVDVAAGIDIPDGMLMPDAVERLEQVKEGQKELEARSLKAGEERASLLEQVASLERRNNMTITRSGMTPEAIEELVNRRVEEALAAYEATRAANALEAESQSQNDSDGDNGNGGNGNGGDGNGGNGNPNKNNRDARPVVRECTYQDFMKCQPLNFKGTE
ncbi:hypothetical protein Tco_0451776 [Tanacetum coccineum]